MHGLKLHARHHALHHQTVDHCAHERDERLGIAGPNGAVLDRLPDARHHGAAVGLEDTIAHLDELRHALACAPGDRLREEDDAALAPVVERVHGLHLRVELLERVRVRADALDDEDGLLLEQILERGLDDVAARREVIEQRRPLDLERVGEPLDRHVEPLALEHGHRPSGELTALVDLDGAGHPFPDDLSDNIP